MTTISHLERLPSDVFGHILALCGCILRDPVPLCSKRCQEMWLEFAERKTAELADEFVRPFEFNNNIEGGTSVTNRYYQVVGACTSLVRDAKVLSRNRTLSMPQTFERVEDLLSRNHLPSHEWQLLDACGVALADVSEKLRSSERGIYGPLERVSRYQLNWYEEHVAHLERLFVSMADRARMLFQRTAGDMERHVYIQILMQRSHVCRLKSPPDHDTAVACSRQLLLVDPMNCVALFRMSRLYHRQGNAEQSFESIQNAVRSGCSNPTYAKHTVGSLGSALLARRRFYGSARTKALLEEAISLLDDLLSREGSTISDQDRAGIVAQKGKIESCLGRIARDEA
jgi:hypothetical protein